MPVPTAALKKHPGANPAYKAGMRDRAKAQAHNREARLFNVKARALGLKEAMPLVAVPKQPSKYVPHYGAKEAMKYAAREAQR